MRFLYALFLIVSSAFLLSSCSVSNQIAKSANRVLLQDSVIKNGHIGISLFEPSTGKWWYNHNAEKYFIPASNVKLFTLYAGMKFLGDSLAGLKYYESGDTIYAQGTGDPTFMHPDFSTNPVKDFLKKKNVPIVMNDENWRSEKFGSGWAWDDYNYSMMPERSPFPVAGNILRINFNYRKEVSQDSAYQLQINPPLKPVAIRYLVNDSISTPIIKRQPDENCFEVTFPGKNTSAQKDIPFVTHGLKTAVQLLKPGISIIDSAFAWDKSKSIHTVPSQPTNSLFKLMMHRSDNFLAEQALLMVSGERLYCMSDQQVIDNLLENEFKDIPQKPRWADGSGLSRYNLFSPSSFVYILNKMKNEFGMERLKTILPTGGEGTLSGYFLDDSSFIFAKTGTLSNCTALSGFLYTKKGKLIIFSILINNFVGKAGAPKQAIERFLQLIRAKY